MVSLGRFFALPAGIAVGLSLAALGCGSQEPATEEWETTPTVSPTASLEYRVDSLKAANRRLREQLDALATENRSLTAKNAEMETKQNEAVTTPKLAPPPADLQSGYNAALAQYRKRDFSGAVEQFQALLTAGITEDLADNCYYWLGESNYGMKKYSEAIQNFEKVLGYKHSEKKDGAQLMIGNSYLAEGNKDAAKEAYQKVLTGYPTSPLVKKAQARILKLQ
jgi:TolA-binding protein